MMDVLRSLVKRLLGHQFVWFLITGVLNTAFGYAVYVVGLLAGLSPAIALATATVIGACFNYVSTGRLVFNHSSLRRLPQFLVAYGTIYLVNILALHWLLSMGVGAAVAQGVLTPFVAALSFVILKLVVFRQERRI